jgi:hypothetical protein
MTVYVPSLTEKDLAKIILSIQQLAQGRSNGVGTVTLAASATSTTVTDGNCAAGTVPILVPTTSDAAAEIKNGTLYIATTTILNGSFVITHASNSQTDRTFLYALHG